MLAIHSSPVSDESPLLPTSPRRFRPRCDCAGRWVGRGLRARAQPCPAHGEQSLSRQFRRALAARTISNCWYRVQTGPSTWEYVLVNAESGALKRAPDAAALGLPQQTLTTSQSTSPTIHPSRKTGGETSIRFLNHTAEAVEISWIDPEGNRKPYGHIKPGDKMEQQTFAGHVWLVADAMGGTLAVFDAQAEPIEMVIDAKSVAREQDDGNELPGKRNVSPDGRWEARIENHNVVLRDVANGETTELTRDGTDEREYRGPVAWAPDSQSFVVTNVGSVPQRQVHVVESSPTDQLQPKLITYPYTKPGDPLPNPRPVLVRLAPQRHADRQCALPHAIHRGAGNGSALVAARRRVLLRLQPTRTSVVSHHRGESRDQRGACGRRGKERHFHRLHAQDVAPLA